MSSPPQGRALTFPIAWTARPEHLAPQPELSGCLIPTDEEVMVRLQERDADVLEVLFYRYSRLTLMVARGILRDTGEAEDVVQDAFFYVYKKARLFDPSKGSVKNWIVQIAFHRALDRKAHLTRRGFYTGTDVGSLEDILLGETDLDREISAKLNRVQLQKAFLQLPEIQRQTLELFYFEGLELREISEKLNEPLGNTRHHFYRGLERLRKSAFVQKLRGNGR
jgi:RNA polymerase sigma-70 factor, ECF subfamily